MTEYPRTSEMVEHVRTFGAVKTYAMLSQEFGMPKTAVQTALTREGLNYGHPCARPQVVTLANAPWEES